MNMETALSNLGVREDTLTVEEKASLDQKGYLPFFDFLSQDQVNGFKERLDEIAPDEVKLIAPAGTVVVFNSHAWHGGTLNRIDSPRRVIHSAFIRRDQAQQTDQKKHILPETYNRLSPEARLILDV